MNIDEAQGDLNVIANMIQEQLNGFHKRTGMLVDVHVGETETTEFQDSHRRVHYSVSLEAKMAKVHP